MSDGSIYLKTGFQEDGIIPPDYSYLVKKRKIHKFNYRLKRFRNDQSLVFREGLSESELAILNKIPRIWDCGKVRYKMLF